MAFEEIGLGHGHQANLGSGSVGVVYVREGGDGGPPEVVIAVQDDSEHDFTLRPGDTFPLGDQIWKLDDVKDPGDRDWTVVITRVE